MLERVAEKRLTVCGNCDFAFATDEKCRDRNSVKLAGTHDPLLNTLRMMDGVVDL